MEEGTDDLASALSGLREARVLLGGRPSADDRIPVLIAAAKTGHIDTLACAMPVCVCPEGRTYFTRRGTPRNGPWGPSADRWPLPGRAGGSYIVTNVRLAHRRCNQVEGGRAGGKASLGKKRVISPEHRAKLVLRGKALAVLARTPEGRERSRLFGLRYGPEAGRKGGLAGAAWRATPEGRATLLRALDLARQTPEQLSANARKANCVRWGIGRGKPCTCGAHI